MKLSTLLPGIIASIGVVVLAIQSGPVHADPSVRTDPPLPVYHIEVVVSVSQSGGDALPAATWVDVEAASPQAAADAFARALAHELRREVHVVGSGALLYGQ